MHRLLISVLGCAFASACASTIDSRDASLGGVGSSYMAPMRTLQIEATRAPALTSEIEDQLAEAQAAFVRASSALMEAQAVENTARREAAAAAAALDALASDAPAAARTALTTARDAKAASYAQAQAATRVARDRAEPARQLYEGLVRESAGQELWQERVSITIGPAVGDPRTRFVADLNDSFFRSSRGKLEIVNGLLQSAHVTTEGNIDEIAESVVSSIVSLSAAGGRLRGRGAGPLNLGDRSAQPGQNDPPPPPACDANEIVMQPLGPTAGTQTLIMAFDPADPAAVRNVNFSLCRAGFSRRIFVDRPDAPEISVVGAAPSREAHDAGAAASRAEAAAVRAETAAARASAPTAPGQADPQTQEAFETALQRTATSTGLALDSSTARVRDSAPRVACPEGVCPGLVYRQPQPFGVHIVKLDEVCASPSVCPDDHTYGLPYVERTWSFNLPNDSPLDVLPYDSAWFVTRLDNAAFVDGSLVSLDYDHPSEIAAAAGIPVRLINAASTALANVFQLRINLEGKESELETALRSQAAARVGDPGQTQIDELNDIKQILTLQIEIQRLRDQLAEMGAPVPQ